MTGEIDPVSGTHRWNPYATGQKQYGASRSSTATSGKIGAAGMRGYAERDAGKKTAKPKGQSTLQQAALRAAVARRYGRAYPGTTTTPGA
jgi:hypothetical protein